MKKRIGVIFGGRSGEHEISIRSAATVLRELDRSKFEPVPIAIDQQGRWMDPSASLEMFEPEIADGIRNQLPAISGSNVTIAGDTRFKGLMSTKGELGLTPIDVFFPVLHGTFGEDGTVQGLLEMADVPYVGCGVLASSCGMDKVVMKILFHDAGLPICRHVWFLRHQFEANPDAVCSRVADELGFPCFVKPANLGSSVGVSRVEEKAALNAAVALAAQFDRKIIVEECLDMREIECAVLGNDEPAASLPGEYIIRDETKAFLDYTEKYSGTGNNEFVVPAPISEELSSKIRDLAIKAFKAVDGSGLARVDFFLRKDTGTLLVNEINTMPGLTDASGFPKMWEGSGRSFGDVLENLIELAVERHADRARNKTSRD